MSDVKKAVMKAVRKVARWAGLMVEKKVASKAA